MARWPWESEVPEAPAAQDDRGLTTSTLLGTFSINRRLTLLDLRVTAFTVERWREQGVLSADQPAKLNLYELGWAIFGRKPGKAERDALRDAIQRLFEVQVDAAGVDARTGKRRLVARKGRIFAQVDSVLDDLEVEGEATPTRIGGLRGGTFELYLGPWLAEQIKAGGRLDVDLAVLRQLRKLAERLWIYLEAEAFTDRAPGTQRLASPIPLGAELFASLRINCARPTDARRALNQAGRKICVVDHRYRVIATTLTPVGHVLDAVRGDERLFDAPPVALLASAKEAINTT